MIDNPALRDAAGNPESESDFPVVARTADFDRRGGIHTAEGGPSGP